MTGRRSALLLAISRYDNRSLQKLRSPVRDVEGLAEVLRDQEIGNFEVSTVVDGRHHEINRAVEEFFLERTRSDFLLLHVSCHGILNNYGELYFAARDTDRKLLGATAVSSVYLRTQLERCRARSIVVLLDCCYSGAFLRGAKGDTEVHVAEELAGHGRAILTATNHTEYAWEGDHIDELDPEPSRFTGAIIEGLRSGEADSDRDGRVSVQDLYEYVCEQMRAGQVVQSPQLSAELENKLWIAHSPLGQLLTRGGMAGVAFPQELAGRRLAVGFTELVDFARLTRQLDEANLGQIVEIFQSTAADLVAVHGGWLIKTVGDEVRYVADGAGTAAEIALRLIETMESHESMPELRVGIAFGTVTTTRMGDVYGATVCLASALRSIAPNGAVLVDSVFAEEVSHAGKDSEEQSSYNFMLQPMSQRPVHGLGQVEPWLLQRRHTDTLTTLHNMAYWRRGAGEPTGPVFKRLLADEERVLGPDHPETLTTRQLFAYWQGKAGDASGAAAAFKQLRVDQERVLGPDHPETLTTRRLCAHWQGEAGDVEGAVTALEQLLADCGRVLGPDHPYTLTARAHLAYWQRKASATPLL